MLYTHIGIRDQSAVLDALPKAEPDKPTRQVAHAKATGTDDISPSHASSELHYAQQLGGISGPASSSAGTKRGKHFEGGKFRNALTVSALDTSKDEHSCTVKNAPGRTRTCDLRFRKPPLYPD